MKYISYLLSLVCVQFSFGQDLAVDRIPVDLKINVDAVIRYDHQLFEIQNSETIRTTRSWAVTIFNENGADEHATFQVAYSKLSDIKDIECSLYDENGERLKNLKKKDIKDIGLGYQSDWVTDLRVKIASFDDKNYSYPYTVVFSYEEISNNPMFFPTWQPTASERSSVQLSTFEVRSEGGLSYRYKEINYLPGKQSDVIIAKNNKAWKVENFKPQAYESYSQNNDRCTVILAPVQIQFDKQNGMMQSWSSIGKFYHEFNNGTRELPAETITKVKSLVKSEDSWDEKVKKVYQYMQSHTRYMSIQLGVGGWRSMPAELVATKGYGDCKALTNYTVAMLNELGIEAYPALINAGSTSQMKHLDVPRMAFNHVIACVPSAKDTIWLECTSQDNPFGYLGDFTGDRAALLIKPSGGELVYTKRYDAESNFQKRNSTIDLSIDGSAKIHVTTKYGGLQQDSKAARYTSYSENDQRNWLMNSIDLPSFDLKSNSFELLKEGLPQLNEIFEIESRKLASKSGKRLFLKANLMTTFFGTPEKLDERRTEIFLNKNSFAFEDIDTTVYHLPEGLKIEYMPQPTTIQSDFGTYENSFEHKNGELRYIRKVKMSGGTYGAGKYTDFYQFVKEVNKADATKVVFVIGET